MRDDRRKLEILEKSVDGELTTSRMAHAPACPHCGRPADGAMGLDDETPRDGDISICGYCINISIFQANGTLRVPTDAEAIMIAGDPRMVLLVEGAKRVREIMEAKQP